MEKEGQEFRSLEVRGKLIALKKNISEWNSPHYESCDGSKWSLDGCAFTIWRSFLGWNWQCPILLYAVTVWTGPWVGGKEGGLFSPHILEDLFTLFQPGGGQIMPNTLILAPFPTPIFSDLPTALCVIVRWNLPRHNKVKQNVLFYSPTAILSVTEWLIEQWSMVR